MFLEESLWIKSQLYRINLKAGSVALDLGSASLEYRTKIQPYIDNNVFKPLREMGCRVSHLDSKEIEGIDIVCDINHLDIVQGVYDMVLCNNLLEHIESRERFVRNVLKKMADGGYLIVTVPYNLDYHPDPIDTLYRPSPQELIELFKPLSVLVSELIETPSTFYHYNRLRAIVAFLMKKRYKTSCVVLRKNNSSNEDIAS